MTAVVNFKHFRLNPMYFRPLSLLILVSAAVLWSFMTWVANVKNSRNITLCLLSFLYRHTLKMEAADSSKTSETNYQLTLFEVFSTVHRSIELFHQPTLMHNFLYSLTICLLHYYPRHVSSVNMPIFRRKNCMHTASGIFALCKCLHSILVESGESALNQVVRRTSKLTIQ